MKTYTKNFIGKGKQVGQMNIIKVIIPLEEVNKTIFELNGVKYVGFEIAKMQNPDKFGRTHTAYYQTLEITEDKKETEAPPTKKRASKKSKAETSDLPF